jgi:AraC family transcriptional regulator of adaptative response/methylated-DNA-[protein]-cysteine methyltransferase
LIVMAGDLSWAARNGSPESDSIAMLDIEECERARVRRDRRYDGRFFSGVRTTRIYCRPVCPVRPAQGKNVTFYPTAAAAEAAGFRPCLRCRPETAPFSPAWQGSRTTVQRAMRLIRGGALDRAGVDDLASRLGIGARHLDRLFQRHVGASPLQVARTMRVQRAKRLLDQTRLPMSEVAARSGFASLRRFNAVFAEVYKRPPSDVRRLRFKPV